MKRPAVLLIALGVLAAAYGGSRLSSAATSGSKDQGTRSRGSSVQPQRSDKASPGTTKSSGGAGQASVAQTKSSSDGAACESSVILPVVKEIAPDIIVGVDIQQCQNGYARVFATPEDPNRYESEQVFLKDEEGSWKLLTYGTGISCQDPDILDELIPACEALGLR
jgi:hypothetical protein